ncbi:MAG: hypothetical protein SCH71_16670 [Desulfobulbaceae bacterium]|nr:hypothetical protein [Desulfobulbaceae bacterium]
MKTDKNRITPAKKNITIDAVDPFHRILLKNRAMTTDLLEQLTGTVIATVPCNRVRKSIAARFSVLTGNGAVFVFAGSTINLPLLPDPAVNALLRGKIPLGRIFSCHAPANIRANFRYFTIRDEQLAAVMRGRLQAGSSGRNAGAALDLNPDTGLNRRRFIRSVLNNPCFRTEKRYAGCQFPGRSYDIFSHGARIAHIEEIFSPRIKEEARKQRLLHNAAFAGAGEFDFFRSSIV